MGKNMSKKSPHIIPPPPLALNEARNTTSLPHITTEDGEKLETLFQNKEFPLPTELPPPGTSKSDPNLPLRIIFPAPAINKEETQNVSEFEDDFTFDIPDPSLTPLKPFQSKIPTTKISALSLKSENKKAKVKGMELKKINRRGEGDATRDKIELSKSNKKIHTINGDGDGSRNIKISHLSAESKGKLPSKLPIYTSSERSTNVSSENLSLPQEKKKLVVRGLKRFVETHGGQKNPPNWVRDFPIKSKYHVDNYIYDWEEGPKKTKRPPQALVGSCTKKSGRCDACGIYSVDTCRSCKKCHYDCNCPKPPANLPDLNQAFGPGWSQAQKIVCELAGGGNNSNNLTQDERRAPIGRKPRLFDHHQEEEQQQGQAPHLKCHIDVLNPMRSYQQDVQYAAPQQPSPYGYYSQPPPQVYPSYYAPPPQMFPSYYPQPQMMMPPPPQYFQNPYGPEPPRNYYQ